MEINGFYFKNTCREGMRFAIKNPNKNQKLFLWSDTVLPETHHQNHPARKYRFYW
jgi:hypothetical protein